MSDLEALYQELILEHNKRPKNFKALNDATGQSEGYNPLCGDRLTVYVKINSDKVQEISFEGSGCAISKASASMMTVFLSGRSTEQVRDLIADFNRMLTDKESSSGDFGKLQVFQNIWKFPTRVKCANLAWHALAAALDNQTNISTE